jgi:hypothetical protein
MKVYVLFAGNVSSPRTMGLYKTKAKANEVKQRLDTGTYWESDKKHEQYDSRIELWEVEK